MTPGRTIKFRDKIKVAMIIDHNHCIESSNDEIPKLIFFDTSTEDVDININQKLIEFIGRYFKLVALSLILRVFILQLKKILTQSCPSQEGKKSR